MDRGDAQRAADYYADLAVNETTFDFVSFSMYCVVFRFSFCFVQCMGAEWRKRKEWELDIVHSTIHGLSSEVN